MKISQKQFDEIAKRLKALEQPKPWIVCLPLHMAPAWLKRGVKLRQKQRKRRK